MQTPIRGFPRTIVVERLVGLASRLTLLVALVWLALFLGQLLSGWLDALTKAQQGLDRFAGQLLLGLLEHFAPQLGNFF